MPTRKREITIRFVTGRHEEISSIVASVSDLADDVTITSKVIGRTAERTAAKKGTTIASTNGPDPGGRDELTLDRPKLAYTANREAKHKRYIDVEASLKRLGLTREQLMARRWPKGSPQHRLKRAAVHNRRPNDPTGASKGE